MRPWAMVVAAPGKVPASAREPGIRAGLPESARVNETSPGGNWVWISELQSHRLLGQRAGWLGARAMVRAVLCRNRPFWPPSLGRVVNIGLPTLGIALPGHGSRTAAQSRARPLGCKLATPQSATRSRRLSAVRSGHRDPEPFPVHPCRHRGASGEAPGPGSGGAGHRPGCRTGT